MNKRRPTEKALFVSIWLIIIVSFATWKLSQGPIWSPPEDPLPDLRVARGLAKLFSEAWVERASPTSFSIGLRLSDRYREQLQGQTSQLNIGFEFRGGNSTIIRGTAPCVVTRDIAGTTVQLENPNRYSPQEIHLYLPH